MKKILMALKSRTVWTVVVLFLVSGVQGIQDLLPASAVVPIQGLLTFLVAYFRVTPKA